MKFLSMIRVQENTGQQPSQRLMAEMGKLMDEMTKSGALVKECVPVPITSDSAAAVK